MSEVQKPLQRLPMELLRWILASLPDIQSLASAALSCRSLYWAFKYSEDGLIKDVLVNCIGFDAPPEAIIAFQLHPSFVGNEMKQYCDNLTESELEEEGEGRWAIDMVYHADFITRNLKRPNTSAGLTMRDALALSNFHLHVVEKLMERFLQACKLAPLPSSFLHKNVLCPGPVTWTEKERIVRAFYRFELLWKLFGCFERYLIDSIPRISRFHYYALYDIIGTFLSKFAPWENLQLGCIHDFLASQVFSAFNDASKRDIIWAQFGPNFKKPDPSVPVNQFFMTLGPEMILKIASCVSDTVHETLLPVKDNCPNLFQEAFRNIQKPWDSAGNILNGPPFGEDEDSGPKDFWERFQEEYVLLMLDSYEGAECRHRRWGCGMWDRERLEALGALEMPLGDDEGWESFT